jgi:cell division septal protein FtsQ
MWFKRKAKNRRLGREFVLDVKLRSSQIRAARARMAAIALGVVFAAVLGMFLVWRGGAWVLDQLLYENRAFAIEQIDIKTDGVLAVDKLRRWSGIKYGENLFALDLGKIRRDLGMVSIVKSVSVERVPPRTLRIRVCEREPIAQINLARPRAGGGFELATYHLDEEGYVMLPVDPRDRAHPPIQPPDPLPEIVGPNANELQVGRRLESASHQAALQLITAFEHSPMAGLVDLKRIDSSAADVVVVTTGQGSEVVFGLTNSEWQLRRWAGVFGAAQRLGKSIATLDLAVTNNIPLRLVDADPLSPVVPKLPKSTKKKHV